jgi:hypothetical protein
MHSLTVILPLALHLLAANMAAAGPLVAAWMAGRGLAGVVAARRLVVWSLAGLVVGGLLGAGLLLAPSDALRTALARFPAKAWWFAGIELGFSAACLVGMLAALRGERRRIKTAWLLALLSSSNLLYHFPPMMAVIGRIANEPQWAKDAVITRRAMVQMSLRPDILSLWIHFGLASLAVAAIAAMALVALPSSTDAGDADPRIDGRQRLVSRLAGIALAASALQLPVGGWLLAASEVRMRDALLGGDLHATGSFLAGVLATMALLQSLAAVMMGDATATMQRRTIWLTLIVIVLMSATLSLGRAASTAPLQATSLAQPPAASSFFSGSLLTAS